MRLTAAHQIKFHNFSICKKTINCKFGSPKGHLQIINWNDTPIINPSCCKWTSYLLAQKWHITWMAIAQRLTKEKILNFSSIKWHMLTHSCEFLGASIPNSLHSKKSWTSWYVKKISKNQHLIAQKIANQSHIKKLQTGYVESSRPYLWTDFDQICQCQVPFDSAQWQLKCRALSNWT